MKNSFGSYIVHSYLLLLVQLAALANANYYCWGKAKRHSLSFISSVIVDSIRPDAIRLTIPDLRGGGLENPKSMMATQSDEQRDTSSPDDEQGCRPLDSSVDFSDNEIQKQILLKHYRNEGCDDQAADGSPVHKSPDEKSLKAFLKDYTGNSVVHQVIDGVAVTNHGKEGARRLWEVMCGPHHHLKVQHLLVQDNHAKVVWEAHVDAERTSLDAAEKVLVGTDWFTFDLQNHIQTQTTVALSEEK
eukprot:scaffold287_cov173-Amphora_coffeaeformis.AAC.18